MQRLLYSRATALLLIAAALMFVPPLLWIFGVTLYAIATYSGTCPGLMDIPAYPCSLGEFIGRNTFGSPFALAGNLVIMGAWMIFALIIDAFMALLLLGMKFFERRKTVEEAPRPSLQDRSRLR